MYEYVTGYLNSLCSLFHAIENNQHKIKHVALLLFNSSSTWRRNKAQTPNRVLKNYILPLYINVNIIYLFNNTVFWDTFPSEHKK